ncbi:MAG TPA: hypothetical protein ENL22_09235, partial [candidate division Zixibacteria bacterium]|nr:hypothetical protein [candidate division Zixibacteria bacterium]
MSSKTAAIILAAGKGKRMKSDLPKVLHCINEKPLVRILMETMTKLSLERQVVVVGFRGEMVIDELADFNVDFVWQKEQLGTGHAVMQARALFEDFDGTILVMQEIDPQILPAFCSYFDEIAPIKVVPAEDNIPLRSGVCYLVS